MKQIREVLVNKFLDNASDYAGRRIKIDQIDNKSLYSHPDHYISLVQDDASLEDVDRNGNYFLPFTDPDEKCPIDKEINDPKSIWSMLNSESLNGEVRITDISNKKDEVSQLLSQVNISMKKTDSLMSFIDKLRIKIKDYKSVELNIKWDENQLSGQDLNSIFEKLKQINKISVIDSISWELLFSSCRKDTSILRSTEFYEKDIHIEKSKIYSSPTQTLKRDIGRGHHKWRSMNEWEEWMGKLTEDDPYKDEYSASKINTNNRQVQYFSTHKYTWRYDIQIENDREFQVARKLIGPKGCNMKRILEEWNQIIRLMNNEREQKFNSQDIVKLRLRGKGSGFKEGPNNEESNDPLHLCISSKFEEVYEKAWEMTEDLIISVYEQFHKHQLKKNSNSK